MMEKLEKNIHFFLDFFGNEKTVLETDEVIKFYLFLLEKGFFKLGNLFKGVSGKIFERVIKQQDKGYIISNGIISNKTALIKELCSILRKKEYYDKKDFSDFFEYINSSFGIDKTETLPINELKFKNKNDNKIMREKKRKTEKLFSTDSILDSKKEKMKKKRIAKPRKIKNGSTTELPGLVGKKLSFLEKLERSGDKKKIRMERSEYFEYETEPKMQTLKKKQIKFKDENGNSYFSVLETRPLGFVDIENIRKTGIDPISLAKSSKMDLNRIHLDFKEFQKYKKEDLFYVKYVKKAPKIRETVKLADPYGGEGNLTKTAQIKKIHLSANRKICTVALTFF